MTQPELQGGDDVMCDARVRCLEAQHSGSFGRHETRGILAAVCARVGFGESEKPSIRLACTFSSSSIKKLPTNPPQYRLIKGLLSHVTLGRRRPISPGPSALFQPLIVSSSTSLWETDYNLHKSNSTYFSDLDIARMHIITCLMKTGLHKAHCEKPTDENEGKYGKSAGGGRLGVMLGGVACNFKKEIKPYEPYEIWTRVLAWDRKWIYLVSHIVKKGAVKPPGYSQQPGKKPGKARVSSKSASAGPLHPSASSASGPAAHPAIFATSIAKYVFKSGRITIPPELVLQHGELLPPKPEGLDDPSTTASPVIEATEMTNEAAAATVQSIASLNGEEIVSGPPDAADSSTWTWERIEAERLRGMKIAQHYAELDQLHSEFTADTVEALGEW